MSKKHPGVKPWYREHMQLGRRKKFDTDVAEEPVTDARKPPGWRGRKATREAASQEKIDQGGKPAAEVKAVPGAKPTLGAKPIPGGKSASGTKPTFAAKPGGQGKSFAGAKPGFKAKSKKPAPKRSLADVSSSEHKVTLDGEGRPYLTLVQFMKTIAAVGTGGAGKHAIRAGGMLVNGTEELRPGRKLHAGDVVTIEGAEHPVKL